MTDANDYLHFFNSVWECRKTRNPRYSLRAYARDLGMPASKLSQILRGRCGLSETRAREIAEKMGLSTAEKDIFATMVATKHSRSDFARKKAQQKLENFLSHASYRTLSLDAFKIISDWYHLAILELTDIVDFRSDPKWIARRLQIPLKITKEAIDRLLEFGLLDRKNDGTFFQTDVFLQTPSGIPSLELRKHHSQILSKADEALTKVPVELREFSSTTFTISESQIALLKKQLQEFRKSFATEATNAATSKERVYCLSMQFFPLDHIGEKP
ncbi:MAG: TIGR02147 family protein [Bdellovibrio sp.]